MSTYLQDPELLFVMVARLLHWDSMQIFRNIGKRKFILEHGQRLLSEAAQMAFCSAAPGNSNSGSVDDHVKVVGTPDNLLRAQFKIGAACDRLQLLQESMQLLLDNMLPEHLKNKAGWFDFCDYVTHEIQVHLPSFSSLARACGYDLHVIACLLLQQPPRLHCMVSILHQ